jgi:hypothetical protein
MVNANRKKIASLMEKITNVKENISLKPTLGILLVLLDRANFGAKTHQCIWQVKPLKR